jgi:nucleoid-associated protein YgaU
MIFRWGKKSRSLLLTLILGLAGGACSSSSESQQETIEADESQQGASENQDSASEEASNQAAGDNVAVANAQVNEASEQGLASLIDDVSNANAEQKASTQAEQPALAEEPAAEAPVAEAPVAEAPVQNAEMATPLTNETALSEVAAPQQTEAVAPSGEAAPQVTSMPGLPELGAKLAYIVEKGDTLAKISEKVYGNASKWKELASLAGISNPNKIYPGEVIYYQLSAETSAFASSYESLGRSAITVVKGDTLAKISAKVYGTSSKWRAIWRENEQVQDPESLTEGGVIYYVNYPSLSATSSSKEESKGLTNVSTQSEELDNEVFELDSIENHSVKVNKSSVSMKTGKVLANDEV